MRSFWNFNLIYTDFAHLLLSTYWPPCLFYETLNKGMVMSKQIVGKSWFRLNCVNLCKMLKKVAMLCFFGAGLLVLVFWLWYLFLGEHIDMFSITTHVTCWSEILGILWRVFWYLLAFTGMCWYGWARFSLYWNTNWMQTFNLVAIILCIQPSMVGKCPELESSS